MAKRIKRDLAVEDTGVASLQFRNGALGELNTSWSLHIDIGMRNVLEIYGSRGTMIVELTTPPPPQIFTTNAKPSPPFPAWFPPTVHPRVNKPPTTQTGPPPTN